MLRAMSELDDFPVRLTIPVAWGDMDAFAHVNNTVYLRWFESARIAYFERIGFGGSGTAAVGPILARTQAVYRMPLTYPDTVQVGARVSELEDDRFTMLYRVVSERHGAIACEGDGRIVSYDYRAAAKAPLPATVRAAIEVLES